MTYTAKTFALPALSGISPEQVAVHLKLYEGYVAHTNKIATLLAASRDGSAPLDAYAEAELRRRFAFEFCGMRLHEYYFEQFENGAKELSTTSRLAQHATKKYGSVDAFTAHIKTVAGTRGIGWVVITYDKVLDTLHTTFVADHELGNLAGLPVILALDLWEHAYMVDRVPAQKLEYVDAFFTNLNWDVIEKRLP
ncbi:hypothetical protein A3C89_00085 [Candidatus Kaiserbacteria bacterium RIFCSPHIGHO2_02_FULL_50_50]|uniref:superoxide dismutase n=1 Tax=Candidatus Kaiserbacteria bacterium RIFCSPHIGHO2_02_FULL_50_50 TaxID=1798492 RepID=A0A1F6DDV9_9BACT|nr:MAG: hypothetical protein A3C89_00085 [Candidatus Kaiserbacteria bacterium RIFCSPHIGHO2_02_FULL_50_50]OGG88440.1 MAG: hypothetical protein A3G62_01735 [Candidatus Kaiserbacteria bacterium RIFCSPLOWO2_12_FULL_50_10]